ncbi:MAG: serine/threonine protein kinase [Deltaproteobacteria bacterium]
MTSELSTPTVPDTERSAQIAIERFGRYELAVELASGGMATVYLARSTGPDGFFHLCAVKRIHPHLAKQQAFVDMFLDEARIAARIDHPNVCQVYDFGRQDGGSFIAMEYLAGETLARVMGAVLRDPQQRAAGRTTSLFATIVAEASEGLHAAHELKDVAGEPLHVVHRDISPQNLFVTYDGAVKVVDFGIASARDKVHETDTGEVKGKFAYMAPEQMIAGRLDRRADVWALGVVLWEMLAQKRLFRRDTQAETIHAVQRATIPPPSSVLPGIPKVFDEITLRALQRNVEERTPSARALARELTAAIRAVGEPVDRSILSDWMDALFPDGRARRAQLTALAASGANAAPLLVDAPTPTQNAPQPEPASVATRLARPGGGASATPTETPRRFGPGAALAALLILGSIGTWWAIQPPTSQGRSPQRVPSTPPALPVAPLEPPQAAPTLPAVEPPPDRAEPPVNVTSPVVERSRIERAHRRPTPQRPEPVAPIVVDNAGGAGEGCLMIAAEISVRVDEGALVEGPRRCLRVSTGPHHVAVLGADGATPLDSRTVTVASGASVAVRAP